MKRFRTVTLLCLIALFAMLAWSQSSYTSTRIGVRNVQLSFKYYFQENAGPSRARPSLSRDRVEQW